MQITRQDGPFPPLPPVHTGHLEKHGCYVSVTFINLLFIKKLEVKPPLLWTPWIIINTFHQFKIRNHNLYMAHQVYAYCTSQPLSSLAVLFVVPHTNATTVYTVPVSFITSVLQSFVKSITLI